MTKTAIISTVGTSLFTNYIEYCRENSHLNLTDISSELKQIEMLSAEELNTNGEEEKEVIEKVIGLNWLQGDHICAEIESITKFMEERNLSRDDVKLYFIATDTAQSKLAMELIVSYFQKKFPGDDIVSGEVANGLRLNNKDAYESEGFNNLLRIINEIRTLKNENLILNISGGYKGIIPYMTIYAQLVKVNIFYLYEDASDIIEIPAMPLSLNINYCMEKLAAEQSDENEKVSNLIKVDSNYNLRPNNKEIVPITRMFNKEITEEFSLNTFLGILVETVLATTHPKEFDDSLKSYINQGTQNIYYTNGNLISDLDCKLVHGNEIGIVESKSINIIKDSKYNTHYETLDKIPPKINYFNNGDRYKVTHFILVLWDISSRQHSSIKVNKIRAFFAEKYPDIKLLIKKINIPVGNSVSATIQKIISMRETLNKSNFIDIN